MLSGRNCIAPAGSENSCLNSKTVTKTTQWWYIMPQLSFFCCGTCFFCPMGRKTVDSSQHCILPVNLRGEWGSYGSNAQYHLTTGWVDLVPNLDRDFRAFQVADVSEREQELWWEESKGIRSFTVAPQITRENSVVWVFMSSPTQIGLNKNLNGSDWLFPSYTIKYLLLLQLINKIWTKMKLQRSLFSFYYGNWTVQSRSISIANFFFFFTLHQEQTFNSSSPFVYLVYRCVYMRSFKKPHIINWIPACVSTLWRVNAELHPMSTRKIHTFRYLCPCYPPCSDSCFLHYETGVPGAGIDLFLAKHKQAIHWKWNERSIFLPFWWDHFYLGGSK